MENACTVDKLAAIDAEANQAAKDALKACDNLDFITDRHVRDSKKAVLTGIVPNKTVAMVKRYLRRECRKPPDMKVRTYYQHLLRINNDELMALPPFSPSQNMAEDELIDILVYATPKSWSREMDRQGFDPINKRLREVVDFMERIEQSEDFDGQKVDHGQPKTQGQGKAKKKSKSSSGTAYCLIHGKGSHSSDECKVLQEQAKKLKEGGTGQSRGKFGNKTWSRKATESSQSSKKDLAAFIKKQVAKGVQKELLSSDKKRKAKEDLDLNAFEGDLRGFNYEDMDNLKIDSDDESVTDSIEV